MTDQVATDGGEVSTRESKRVEARKLFAAGKKRAEIAKELGLATGTIYAYTRDQGDSSTSESGGTSGGRSKIMMPDGETTRRDYIREQYNAGKSRTEIANDLKENGFPEITFQTVFAATKDLEKRPRVKAEKAEKTEKTEKTKKSRKKSAAVEPEELTAESDTEFLDGEPEDEEEEDIEAELFPGQ